MWNQFCVECVSEVVCWETGPGCMMWLILDVSGYMTGCDIISWYHWVLVESRYPTGLWAFVGVKEVHTNGGLNKVCAHVFTWFYEPVILWGIDMDGTKQLDMTWLWGITLGPHTGCWQITQLWPLPVRAMTKSVILSSYFKIRYHMGWSSKIDD